MDGCELSSISIDATARAAALARVFGRHTDQLSAFKQRRDGDSCGMDCQQKLVRCCGGNNVVDGYVQHLGGLGCFAGN